MTADASREGVLPPTALESSVRALGADTVRYRFDYIMLPMRDGVRLATVVIRPRAEGRYPTLMVRTPYAVGPYAIRGGLCIRIGGMTTANYFPAGHRIRIEITGSNFRLADRNWHTGERNDLATDGPVAHITLHHGQGHESALRFRAHTGQIAVNTPMSDARRPGRGPQKA